MDNITLLPDYRDLCNKIEAKSRTATPTYTITEQHFPTRLHEPQPQNEISVYDYLSVYYSKLRCWEEKNSINSNYFQNQVHIKRKMRTILVDWLVRTHGFRHG